MCTLWRKEIFGKGNNGRKIAGSQGMSPRFATDDPDSRVGYYSAGDVGNGRFAAAVSISGPAGLFLAACLGSDHSFA